MMDIVTGEKCRSEDLITQVCELILAQRYHDAFEICNKEYIEYYHHAFILRKRVIVTYMLLDALFLKAICYLGISLSNLALANQVIFTARRLIDKMTLARDQENPEYLQLGGVEISHLRNIYRGLFDVNLVFPFLDEKKKYFLNLDNKMASASVDTELIVLEYFAKFLFFTERDTKASQMYTKLLSINPGNGEYSEKLSAIVLRSND